MSDAPELAKPQPLQERAAAALLRLGALDQRERDDAEVSAIETARARAESALDVLDNCVAADEALADLGVPRAPLDERRKKAAGDARAALRRAASVFSDPDAALTKRLTGSSVQGALKQADDTGRALESSLNAAVEAERQRLRPPDVEDTVPDIPGKYSIYRRILAAKDRLDTPVDGLPVPALVGLVQLLRQSAITWSSLRPELEQAAAALPPAIRAFVEAATEMDGVAWAQLTAEVRAWLDESDHGETYRVRRG